MHLDNGFACLEVAHHELVSGQVLKSKRAGACVLHCKDIAECKGKQEVQVAVSEILNDKLFSTLLQKENTDRVFSHVP